MGGKSGDILLRSNRHLVLASLAIMAILADMAPWSDMIARLGGNVALASALGESPKAVSHWRKRGIPARYWSDVAALAASKSLADITMDTLRRPLWRRQHGDIRIGVASNISVTTSENVRHSTPETQP